MTGLIEQNKKAFFKTFFIIIIFFSILWNWLLLWQCKTFWYTYNFLYCGYQLFDTEKNSYYTSLSSYFNLFKFQLIFLNVLAVLKVVWGRATSFNIWAYSDSSRNKRWWEFNLWKLWFQTTRAHFNNVKIINDDSILQALKEAKCSEMESMTQKTSSNSKVIWCLELLKKCRLRNFLLIAIMK